MRLRGDKIIRRRGFSMSDRPNVVYVVHQYPVETQTFVESEWRALAARGFRVDVFALHGDKRMAIVHEDLRGPRRVPILLTYCKFIAKLLMNFRIVVSGYPGILDSYKSAGRFVYSVVRGVQLAISVDRYSDVHLHAHFLGRTVEVAVIAKCLLGARARLTATGHAGDVANPLSVSRLAKSVERCDAVVCASSFVGDKLVEQTGVFPRMIVHCGVKTRTSSGRPTRPDVLEILSVGRMVPKKGFDDCVLAAQVLLEEGAKFIWTFIGDGPMRVELAQQADKCGLRQELRFVGALGNDKVLETMARADVFVLTPKQDADGDIDGIPVVLMEAMEAGCVVIASRLSGIPELVEHRFNGLLVDPGSPAQISSAINLIRSANIDLDHMSSKARHTIRQDFTAESGAERMEELILSLKG